MVLLMVLNTAEVVLWSRMLIVLLVLWHRFYLNKQAQQDV
jgi:hypothetical protein